jgi:hypothetical protein
MRNVIKAVVVVAAFVGMTNAALANDGTCDRMSNLSKQIMTNRQNGVSLNEMMSTLNSVNNSALKTVTKTMVLDAYEHPRYNTATVKQRTIDEFANKYMLMCVKALSK